MRCEPIISTRVDYHGSYNALQKDTNEVIDFAVGNRTKATLEKVIGTLTMSNADKIFTDRLNLYTFLIPASIHCVKRYGTNHI